MDNLTLSWSIFHPKKQQWIQLGTKGSVQEALIQSGELPDPKIGLNEELFQWIEEESWHFKSEINLSKTQVEREHLILRFPNVDTYAKVFVNGVEIGECENAFRPYSFDLKGFAKEGFNLISVYFESPVKHHENLFGIKKTIFPAPNDVGRLATAPLSRKPQYQFGWDWSMRMNTMGFWSECSIQSYHYTRIKTHDIQTLNLQNGDAKMSFRLELDFPSNQPLVWKSESFNQVLELTSQKGEMLVDIKQAQLWWPRGQGEAHLYSDTWVLSTRSGRELHRLNVSFGVRTAELIQEKDSIGTSYVIKVNGRPVFCKGANYIPQEVFPAAVSEEQINEMVDNMVDANFNMVRVWGGGYYPEDQFYKRCDEEGIMVWQDFMFACAMYPGDDAFIANVSKEFDFQIPRIARHPSVVLFNGNNEVDVAWKNWGFQVRYLIGPSDSKMIKEAYDRLFKKVIPERLKAAKCTVPYIHTSPLSNWGKKEDFNHGSQHYWGVWHGSDPIEDFGKKSGRFNAEYGFQSFPQMSTIATFAEPEQWNLDSSVMKHHQKSYVGNKMISKQSDRLFGKTDDFESFVYRSQLTQAEAVGLAVSSHRIQAPRCMGTLVWQLNDCWSAPTWSSVDYFGNWKALHYRMKKDYSELAVLQTYLELGKELYHVSNMSGEQKNLVLKTAVFNLKGELMAEDKEKLTLSPLASIQVANVTRFPAFQNANFVIEFELFEGDSMVQTRRFSHLPEYTPSTVLKSELSSIVHLEEDQMSGFIEIESPKFLHHFYMTCSSTKVVFEDNDLHILPGKTRIHFKAKEAIKSTDILFDFL